jgi:hypothetical protein
MHFEYTIYNEILLPFANQREGDVSLTSVNCTLTWLKKILNLNNINMWRYRA